MYHGVQHVSCHPPSRPDLVDMLPFGIPSVPIFAGHVGDFFGLHHPTSNLESQLFVAHPIFHPMGIFQTKTGWCFFATPLKNMSSSDWIIIPTIGENKKCSKAPTRKSGR